jgi:hypothetical protein
MRKKCRGFGLAQRCRMPLAMEEDIALDPMDVGLLCSAAVVQPPNGGPDLIQKSGWFGRVWASLGLDNPMLNQYLVSNYALYQDAFAG